MAESYLVIKSARPNGWPIRITQGDCLEGAIWYIEECEDGYWNEVSAHDTLAEAETEFAARVAVLKDIPNWELQARYDEEHGTDNGYAPWQINQEY
jgi:hypothetical protein